MRCGTGLPTQMPIASCTRLIPWAPLVRLLYLAAGVWMIIETGRWSLSLVVPLLLCFLPALLHLTLSLPRSRPLIAKRPYVLRWIYGLPVLALLAWVSAWTIPPVMGAREGNNMGFLLANLYRQLPDERQDSIAFLGLGLAVMPLAWYWFQARVVGWRQVALTHPGWTMLTLLCVPLFGAVAIAQGFAALRLPEAVLVGAATAVHTFLYSQFVLARLTVLVVFPVAITGLLARRDGLPRWAWPSGI